MLAFRAPDTLIVTPGTYVVHQAPGTDPPPPPLPRPVRRRLGTTSSSRTSSLVLHGSEPSHRWGTTHSRSLDASPCSLLNGPRSSSPWCPPKCFALRHLGGSGFAFSTATKAGQRGFLTHPLSNPSPSAIVKGLCGRTSPPRMPSSSLQPASAHTRRGQHETLFCATTTRDSACVAPQRMACVAWQPRTDSNIDMRGLWLTPFDSRLKRARANRDKQCASKLR